MCGSGNSPMSRPSIASVDVDHRVEAELVGERGEPGHETGLLEQLGPQPEDEVADVADGEVEALDRPIDAGLRIVRVAVVDELRDVLERQADGVDALDDPVVQILPDPFALFHDRQPLDLLVEPGVLDRDRRVAARTSRPCVSSRSLNSASFCLLVR